MVAALARPGRELAKRLLMIQFGVVTLVAVGMAATVDVKWGISALIGGGIFVLANNRINWWVACTALLLVSCFLANPCSVVPVTLLKSAL